MKRIIAALVLGAMFVAIGVGCGGPTTPAKPPTTGTEKKAGEEKKTTP